MTPDPLLQELLAESITKLGPIIQAVDAFSAEHGYTLPIGETEIILREILTSAVLRTRERVVEEAMECVPVLKAVSDDYVEFGYGFSECRTGTLQALTALKETNPSTP